MAPGKRKSEQPVAVSARKNSSPSVKRKPSAAPAILKRPAAATSAVKRPAATLVATVALPAKRRRLRGKQDESDDVPCSPVAANDARVATCRVKAVVSAENPFVRVLYIMRGPPGCGKSTSARSLLHQHLVAQGMYDGGDIETQRLGAKELAPFSLLSRAVVCSTDDYFTVITKTGEAEYHFDPKTISEKHEKNKKRCEMLMELGQSPLFVDNTNIRLWEMRTYVQLADNFGYRVCVVDPRCFNPDALNLDVLLENCEKGAQSGARALGKSIPKETLQRMVDTFEDVSDIHEAGVVSLANEPCLQLIREALAPWEKKQRQARYAGLDVEAGALAALGGIPLGPHFWTTHGAGELDHYMGARYMKDLPWQLPERLHVTVAFFRGRDEERRRQADALVGTRHNVTVHALVFARGGGLLCAACAPTGESAETLGALAGEGWKPHVTLLAERPWKFQDSTALINAWEAARDLERVEFSDSRADRDGLANDADNCTTAGQEAMAVQDHAAFALADDDGARGKDIGESEVGVPSGVTAEYPSAGDSVGACNGRDNGLAEDSTKAGDSGDSHVSAKTMPSADEKPPPESTEATAAAPEIAQIFRDVSFEDECVDVVVIPLIPPRSLGLCEFQLFF
eukprot:TRINITY_DN20900_c0_g1_i1.p1 TRINITY_DN20900_c0_g1~~TRINITY_DN20900_c0_g1_i1.p1  ORF type:complete len:651 (-),score=129.67 TRINITY_DN20900_c0_g1_i1:86-1969(-)